jgi:hypothetical protein
MTSVESGGISGGISDGIRKWWNKSWNKLQKSEVVRIWIWTHCSLRIDKPTYCCIALLCMCTTHLE